jgi:Uma2 family endonuclease
MEAVLEPLVQSPKLVLYMQQIQAILNDEVRRREEFYENVREDEKAEFINGEIIMHSPVKIEHNIAGKLLLHLLDIHVRKHGLGFVGYEKLLIALTRNDYEPDLCFFRPEKANEFVRGQMKFPAPDFVVEILSSSTVKNDYGVKFEDYAAHGVEEYWIIDAQNEFVEQYLLHEGAYTLVSRMDSGTIASRAVAGFAIPVRALFDEHENLQALQALLTTT